MRQGTAPSIPGPGPALLCHLSGGLGCRGEAHEEVNGQPLTPRSAKNASIPTGLVKDECSRKVSSVAVLHVSCMFLNIQPFNWAFNCSLLKLGCSRISRKV